MDRLLPRLAAIGTDGLYTLLLSNLVLVLTAGLSLWWPLRNVVNTARNAPVAVPPDSALVVMGMRLDHGEVTGDYVTRLERAIRIYRDDGGCVVLIVGGLTGTATVSEASRGRDYLLTRGVCPEHILIEDASRNTLENLRNARSMLEVCGYREISIISNRYHLARSMKIARGLGMKAGLCGAEDECGPLAALLPRLLLEAYYIHWYHTGTVWSRLTRNRKSLERIS